MKQPKVVPANAGVAGVEVDRIKALNQEIANGLKQRRESFQTTEQRVSDAEKCIRSISYLLQWSSSNGNHDVEGFSAYGLSRILADVAGEVSELFSEDEMRQFLASDGSFSELRSIAAERYR